MPIIVSSPKPNQRTLTDAEQTNDVVEHATYVGVTWEKYAQVWKHEGGKLIRAGVPRFGALPIATQGSVAATLLEKCHPKAILHRMTLHPGQYYPRIARPHDQHPTDMPTPQNGAEPLVDVTFDAARHFSTLVDELDDILKVVAPAAENFEAHGNRIRNLLILTCTECENQMRAVLRENGLAGTGPTKDRYNTNQFVKLLNPMRLDEYGVSFAEMPWLGVMRPFHLWSETDPTKSIDWYERYNASKHDRSANMNKANLISVFQALSALWILLTAQYGPNGWRIRSGSERVFKCVEAPRWRYSDVYTFPYDKVSVEAVKLFSPTQ